MTARPVHRMPKELRRRWAAGYVGRTVVVRWNGLREADANVTVGRLLAVAVPNVAVADLLVVETTSGYWPLAISLATVLTIDEADAGAELGTTYVSATS